jgi:hypothetical protein
MKMLLNDVLRGSATGPWNSSRLPRCLFFRFQVFKQSGECRLKGMLILPV